ncbi:MAG: 4Fe-4S binding protein [Bacteroidaceae bacterium]|nr:4Fe-4S binding protein [Bacteroidaceae bacterium]
MSYLVSKDLCSQDHRCPLIRICSVGAISQNGYGLPVIDKEKCINCGKCFSLCPMSAIINEEDKQ